MSKQTWTAIVSGVLFIMLSIGIAIPGVDFVAWAPGVSYDVLGVTNDRRVIEISNTEVYPTSGQLRLTTISVTSADSSLSLPEAVINFLLPNRDVLPREVEYPVGVPTEQVRQQQTIAMETSQRMSVAAALRAAGYQVDQVPLVTGVVESGPSFSRLQVGDFIDAVDGNPVTSRTEVEQAVQRHAVGDLIQLDVERRGEKLKVSLTTVAANDDPRRSRIGIDMRTSYRYEPTVTFTLGTTIVGPSAGLVFALGVYNLVTPGDLIASRIVAGTGSIDAAGAVSPVSGVREKVAAAQDAKATIFLVPAANCADLVGMDTNVTLVKVGELADAISSLQLLKQPNRLGEVPLC